MTPAPASRRIEWLYIGLVLLAGLAVIAPLLQPGYFWGAHDARHDVYFIFQYDKSVADGIWFPRWSPDWTFGYGYPFFIVYGPLATFAGVLIHRFLGLGFEASVKAVLALSILVSGLGMYGFVRAWLGRNAGLVAAVAYMAIPYHLVDTYVRAALAESVALAFLPLALWGFRAAVLRPSFGRVAAAGIVYAAIMWTSNLVALVFTPALAAYVAALIFWRARSERGRRGAFLRAAVRGAIGPALALAIGLGLSAAFFVPALVEQAYINQTQWFGAYYDPAQHFVYLNQLFSPAWGFGISQPGPDDAAKGGLSFQLGAAASLFSLATLALSRRFSPQVRRELWFWGAWAGVAVFLTLGFSAWVWRVVPIVRFAQFPWRYLMMAILPLSILPGALVADAEAWNRHDAEPAPGPHRSITPAVVLALLLLLSSLPYLRVEMREPTVEQGPVSYAALMRFQRTSDEMTGVTAWVDPALRPRWSDLAELWVQGKTVTTRVDYGRVPQDNTLAVNSEDVGSAHEQVYFHTSGPGQSITFNRFWYPGWTAWLLDGKDGRIVGTLPLRREDGPLARVVVDLPVGDGYLLLRFEDTPLRAAAKWFSVGCVAALALAAGGAQLLLRRRSPLNPVEEAS